MNVTVIDDSSVVVEVGIAGPRGPQGVSGGTALAGEGVTAGMTGVTIAVVDFLLATDYQVAVSYSENPGKNGVLFVEKTATEFVVKHYGTNHVGFGYIVSATGTGA